MSKNYLENLDALLNELPAADDKLKKLDDILNGYILNKFIIPEYVGMLLQPELLYKLKTTVQACLYKAMRVLGIEPGYNNNAFIVLEPNVIIEWRQLCNRSLNNANPESSDFCIVLEQINDNNTIRIVFNPLLMEIIRRK